MAAELEGGCLFGRVRFRNNQAPLRTLACHCTFCQEETGSSYFAESMFPMDAVLFNTVKLSRYEYLSDASSKEVFVHFCPNCGTTVSLTFERWPQIRGISRGCYDDPNAVAVSSHIWTRSAQTGTAPPEGVECFSKARMTLDGQAEPSIRHARENSACFGIYLSTQKKPIFKCILAKFGSKMPFLCPNVLHALVSIDDFAIYLIVMVWTIRPNRN